MSEVLQLAMAGLVVAGYAVLWRLDARGRARDRIDQAHRRNVAENKRTMKKLRQSQSNWEQLNQSRHELNTRYAEVIKTREEHNNRYSETINRMRKHHGIEDAA